MARANKKKLSDIANESDAKYDKVKLQAAAITETFTEGDDGSGHNEEALVYLKLKLEDIIDDINVLATDVVDPNTAKTGITSTQAGHITTNNAKTGISSGQASAITANTAKVGTETTLSTTEKLTLRATVTENRGTYTLRFTMVTADGKTTKTADVIMR
tara:strand:+ start:540 stop:1016 length:477 start_codon:yes stop_codon:yes gene_type:complete